MVPFLLPWSLYVALGCMALAAAYDIASWSAVKFYLQSEYPEQAPRVRTLMAVNRILMIGTMLFGALSVGISGGIVEGIMTALIAAPIVLFGALFYMIFTALHKRMGINASIE